MMVWWIIAILGILLRLFLSWYSIGSNDVVNWYQSANIIREFGLIKAYQVDPYSNNPPLISILVSYLIDLSNFSGVNFPFLLRLCGIIAELLTLRLLYLVGKDAQTGIKLAALYSINPLSILVTGFHGHTDGICTAITFLAFYLSSHKRFFLSGLTFSLALQVKLLPLAIFWALLIGVKDKVNLIKGALIGSFPFLIILVLDNSNGFVTRVLGYRSILDYWGIQTFLIVFRDLYPNYRPIINLAISTFLATGPYIILAANLGLNLFLIDKSKNLYYRAALSYSLMAVLAPGFGITYLANCMPYYFITNLSFGIKFSIINALTLLATYIHFGVSSWPFQTVHNGSSPKLAVLLAFVMWVMLIVMIVDQLRTKDETINS